MTGSDLPTTRETCLDCNQGAVRSVKFNDHIVLKFKRNNTSSSFTSSSSHSHIDIASAADFLSDPAFLAIPETQLVSRINSIFSSCSIQAPRRKKNSKPWFNAHSYDLRARCKLLSQSTNRQDYIIARKAYHHHLHHAKLIYEKNQESALINSALEKGLPALYKSAKAKTNGSTIPISRLHSYANKLFSSDSSYNTFMPIPSCDQNNHSLMSPFLLSELIKILKSVKSKAPSATGCLSPHTLKLLHLDIAPLLLRIFNYALSTGYFPECWLETVLFFLHKKGSKSDPSNYRTIAIENPFLKVFMLLINSRMTQYAESESLLPDFQFGFRPNRNYLPSSLAPASVNFPSDIPINCPLYADDTCLIADTADELQLSLDSLTEYCKINHLIINVSKSKVVVFHKVDGNYCLTCGSDKTLKLWNPFSGTLLQTFSGHGYEVLDAQGSCDNSQLVSCGLDKTAILWDVSTAVPLRKFRGHAAKVNCVRFNEESSVILTGSLDCTVRIWDCRSKSRDPVQTLDEAKDSITSLEVSDHEIVTGSLDCALRRYDIRVGQMFEDTIGRSISCVKFTKDGQCILTKLFG
ncbi:WD repeat domain-containing protein 83 [Nymphon striatum]|nr:WD repeat domain-containing protein 83 [Nymphon striatum]